MRTTEAPGDAEVRQDEVVIAEQRYRATRAVAAASTDATECAMLLDLLDLQPAEGLPG